MTKTPFACPANDVFEPLSFSALRILILGVVKGKSVTRKIRLKYCVKTNLQYLSTSLERVKLVSN